jgi:uncharacterized protein
MNSCCEAQGTRALGSLPEYIYSLAEDGVYVNLFEASSINCKVAGRQIQLEMKTSFPYDKQVEIYVTTDGPCDMKLRIRVPSWAIKDMPIEVNGKEVELGKSRTYAVLQRTWKTGDIIRFVLPMGLRATKYEGMNHHIYTSIAGYDRYAFEYGPLLLAVVFPKPDSITTQNNPEQGFSFNVDITDYAVIKKNLDNISEWLLPDDLIPLQYNIDGYPEYKLKPYWKVKNDEFFTCFPVIIS